MKKLFLPDNTRQAVFPLRNFNNHQKTVRNGGLFVLEIVMYTTEQIKQLIASNSVHKFYNSKYWRRLSKEIKKEYKNECLICKEQGKYSRSHIVHHVLHLKTHPELAYTRMYNGRIQLMPVCLDCHNALHGRDSQNRFTNNERW